MNIMNNNWYTWRICKGLNTTSFMVFARGREGRAAARRRGERGGRGWGGRPARAAAAAAAAAAKIERSAGAVVMTLFNSTCPARRRRGQPRRADDVEAGWEWGGGPGRRGAGGGAAHDIIIIMLCTRYVHIINELWYHSHQLCIHYISIYLNYNFFCEDMYILWMNYESFIVTH